MGDVSIKTLDKYWVDVTRMMFNGKCAVCRRDGHDCHHIIGRSNFQYRWHPLNGLLLCREHHEKAHNEPKWIKDWIDKYYPAFDQIDKLYDFGGASRSDIHTTLIVLKSLLNTCNKG